MADVLFRKHWELEFSILKTGLDGRRDITLHVFCCHLAADGQAKLLQPLIDDNEIAVILGDFNFDVSIPTDNIELRGFEPAIRGLSTYLAVSKHKCADNILFSNTACNLTLAESGVGNTRGSPNNFRP